MNDLPRNVALFSNPLLILMLMISPKPLLINRVLLCSVYRSHQLLHPKLKHSQFAAFLLHQCYVTVGPSKVPCAMCLSGQHMAAGFRSRHKGSHIHLKEEFEADKLARTLKVTSLIFEKSLLGSSMPS